MFYYLHAKKERKKELFINIFAFMTVFAFGEYIKIDFVLQFLIFSTSNYIYNAYIIWYHKLGSHTAIQNFNIANDL